jgi:DNA-binding LacI/PurR family transcriptional regulator
VLDAARQLGYSPDLAARRLRRVPSTGRGTRRRSLVLAIAHPADSRLSLVSRIVSGMQQQLATLGDDVDYEVQLTLETFQPGELHRLRGVAEPLWFNGVVVTNTSAKDDAFLEGKPGDVPLVVFQRQLTNQSTVDADNHAAAASVGRHLAALGHRRMAIVTPGLTAQVQTLRRAGFDAALLTAGLPPAEHVAAAGGQWTQRAYDAAAALLARPAEQRPTAIFATNDLLALGVVRAARERGLSVPDDLAVVGFDDAEFAPFTIPSLTTVHLPVEEMAAQAVAVLLDLIQHKVRPPVHRLLPTRLVVRESCGAQKQEEGV